MAATGLPLAWQISTASEAELHAVAPLLDTLVARGFTTATCAMDKGYDYGPVHEGADFKPRATKWRCPTGECQPKPKWVKANRRNPLVPRSTKRWSTLYRAPRRHRKRVRTA